MPAGGPALCEFVSKVSYPQILFFVSASHTHEVVNWEDCVVVLGQALLEASVLDIPSDQVVDATNTRHGRRHERRDRFSGLVLAERQIANEGHFTRARSGA